MAPAAFLAGGAAGDVDLFGLQIVHQHLAAPAGQRYAENVGRAAADEHKLRDFPGKPLHRPLPERLHPGDILRHTGLGDFAGRAEGSNLRHGLGAGTPAGFLAAADDKGLQLHAVFDVQRADAFRGVDLVAADTDHVRAQGFGGKGDLHKALHRVCMYQHSGTGFFYGPGNRRNIRHRAGFVVDQHQRNEYSIITEGGDHGVQADTAFFVGGQAGHFKAPALQLVQRAAHRVVLHGGADDVLSPASHGFRAVYDGPVVAFRAAGGKNQLPRRTAQGGGDLLPGLFQQAVCLSALGVGGAGVAVIFRHGGKGRLRRLIADLCGGGIVKIVFHCFQLPFQLFRR